MRWFILGAFGYLLLLLSIYLFYDSIYDTTLAVSYDPSSANDDFEYSAGHIFLLLGPFIVAITALGLTGRGVSRGWRYTDLTMPLSKGAYGGNIYGYALKLCAIGLFSTVLFIVSFWLMSRRSFDPDISWLSYDSSFHGFKYIMVSQIISILYAIIIFGLMSPSLATGFYRGSWGWWAFFLLPLPLMAFIPPYITNSITNLGVPVAYVVPFIFIAPVAAIWSYFNTKWYFKKKPDY